MGIMDLFKKKSSGNVAKDRLKLVLVSDRAKLLIGDDGDDEKGYH